MDTPADATVRITPLSLLWSSVLGTAAIAGGALPLLFWWTNGSVIRSPVASGVGLAAGLGGVCLFVFSVGYRRHGRPVPTTVRVDGDQLVIQVPAAWGTLIREELRLDVSSTSPADDDLVVQGAATDWWDPGRYEVRIPPGAAHTIESQLTDTKPGADRT